MFQKKLLVSALAGIGLMASGAAMAGEVQLEFKGGTYGFDSSGDTSGGTNTFAGQFEMGVEGASTVLDVFCIDLETSLIQNYSAYDLKTSDQYSSFTPDIVTNLDRLYSTYYGDVVNKKTSAAFQLGIWEILADTTSANYDLSGGNFTASGYDTGADVLAGSWLNDLGSASGYQFKVAESVESASQDLLVVNPPPIKVPEPGTLALLGLGLAGLALRKRKA